MERSGHSGILTPSARPSVVGAAEKKLGGTTVPPGFFAMV